MTDLRLLLLIAPSLAACAYLVWKAVRVRPPLFRLSDYFLAGGRLGPTMTRANTLGSNIALANGLWYFVVLGYFDGVLGITAQVTWGLSIFLVGFFVPTILEAAQRGQTLHGFLGYSFDSRRLRVMCAAVTGTGYLLNFGFETYVSGSILASMIGGTPELRWILTIVLASSAALYISMSGFLGNVSQDRKQNVIGIASMLAVALLATVSVLQGRQGGTPSPALVAVSWTKYLGIFAYTAIFNMVDVSNWQTVAASKFTAEPSKIPALRRAWTQTALLVLVFPAAIGVYLGILMRSHGGMADGQLFGHLSTLLVPDFGPFLREALLGVLLMGFFVLALGYAENLLSAAQLTFMADVFRSRRYDALATGDDPVQLEKEDEFVHGCRRGTFVIAAVALGLFTAALWKIGEAGVFGFMFIIFGSAISMFPSVVLATIRARRGQRSDDRASRIGALASVAAGYVVAMAPLVFPGFLETSPVFTILAAGGTLIVVRTVLLRFDWGRERRPV